MSHREVVGPALMRERSHRLARWRSAIEKITQYTWDLHHHRAIWREMRDALVEKDADGTFLSHYARLYADSQLMSVRRLVDLDPRSISMARLLEELAQHPETMSRQWHLELWNLDVTSRDPRDQWMVQQAHQTFDRYVDGDGENVDPEAVRKDLDNWKATCGSIKHLVNKRVAHLADLPAGRKVPEVTYDELDKAIDTLAELVKKYGLLFTGSSIVEMEPVVQGDWKSPFRTPLY